MVVVEGRFFSGFYWSNSLWLREPTSSCYNEWSERNFKSITENGLPLPSPKMDTDGDGVSNLMEFYAQMIPHRLLRLILLRMVKVINILWKSAHQCLCRVFR